MSAQLVCTYLTCDLGLGKCLLQLFHPPVHVGEGTVSQLRAQMYSIVVIDTDGTMFVTLKFGAILHFEY